LNRTSPVSDPDANEGEARAPEPAPQIGARLVRASSLDHAIAAARSALTGVQHERGFWLFELEADSTIPAEYILMLHFLGEVDAALEAKLAAYLRSRQAPHGGWPLYQGGDLNISCTVKAYYALKLAGDAADAPHMVRARQALIARGGAARANVFTRITLALFGQVPWRAVPYIPVEIMLLPRWFPFHLDKVSYWSRTVMVPLFILCTQKPRAKNPRQVDIAELFVTDAAEERDYFPLPQGRGRALARAFLFVDRCVRRLDPLVPKWLRRRATQRAEAWVLERLNGEEGLGAIFPAMVNALEAFAVLGYAADDARRVSAKRALQKLLVVSEGSAYCQPCVSPVWDTALAALAMQEEGGAAALAGSERALEWLAQQQLLEEPGDWQRSRPKLQGGGWAFQFSNSFYPDLDDTAVIVWAMRRARQAGRYAERGERALDWLVGMQSRNGGFAAFDVDNVHYRLNYIPFADHGALLDPPTSDVTARVVTVLALADRAQDRRALERAVAYLRAEQEADGSWFGRWGTNYIYGTWSVLMALAQARIKAEDAAVARAVRWLSERQNADGGWGESNDSYAQPVQERQRVASTSFQSAWALLGLIAAGEVREPAVRRGIEYLLNTQNAHGFWDDASFTAPGFPRVFYLKYHGYSAYFPLWALAAYRNLTRSGGTH
jgi:squalene-hopene/tetraprenyl-beta-curcumene cyclase